MKVILEIFRKKFSLKEDKITVTKNTFYLLMIQVANYLLPLITIPYLVKTLDTDKFGIIMFAQSFILYLVVLTEFGFNLTATRDISFFRNDYLQINRIFNNVFFSKVLLSIFSFFILNVFLLSFNKFSDYKLLFYLTFGTVIGNVLFPVWFFQGLEEMKYVSFFNIFSRIAYSLSIFIFVKDSSDYIFVPLINFINSVLIGIFSIGLIILKFGIKLKFPNFKSILHSLKKNIYIFFSTASYNIYSNSPKFIVGIFFSMEIVAYFSLAEKIIFIFRQFLSAIFQSFYPNLAKLLKKSFQQYAKQWKFLFKLTVSTSILFFSFLLFLPKNIFSLIFSEDYLPALYILKLYAISLPLQVLMNLFGMQSMLLLGFSKAYGISYSIISLAFVLALVPLTYTYRDIDYVIYLIIATEIFIVLYRIIFLFKRGFLYELFKY